jgi:Crinkler effector protein N-terminal domain
MSSTLLCFIPSGKRVFSVEIDKTRIVDQLKDAIKKKKEQTLANVEADALTLYRVAINQFLDNEQQEATLTRISENLGEHKPLINTHQLSGIFDEKPPDGEMWVTLVGESIYCGAVVLMADNANADATPHPYPHRASRR